MNTHECATQFLRELVVGTEYEGKLYLAGGCVRDQLLGLPVNDLDLLVVNPDDPDLLNWGVHAAEWIAKRLDIFRLESNPVIFPQFGTAKLELWRQSYQGCNLDSVKVEFVAPRVEHYLLGDRNPQVSAGTLEDDVRRRDFTINSMLQNLSTGEILDLTGRGRQDLQDRVIRTVADDPIPIFTEDALRLLRAVRFAFKYNCTLPPFMVEGMRKCASNLHTISYERIKDELDKILVLSNPSRAFRLMVETNLLIHILPELQDLIGLQQNEYHDQDAFDHTMTVLDGTPAELVRRLSALFHDIGKKATMTQDEDGRIHFYGHAEEGVKIASVALRRLRYSNNVIRDVKKIIAHHMDLKMGGPDANGLKDKHLRKFIFNIRRPLLEAALDVIHADNCAHAAKHAMTQQISIIKQRIENWNLAVIECPDLPLRGDEIVTLGAEGPLIGEILDRLREKWFKHGALQPALAEQIALNMISARRRVTILPHEDLV